MDRLAEGVFGLRGFPPHVINVYLIGDVLIDAGTRHARHRILRQLSGHTVKAHALTHAHPDHQGSSRAVCDALGVPLWCGEAEADAVQSGDLRTLMPDSVFGRLSRRIWAGPACPVARRLREGDEVGGFTVLDVPGHSPGHLAYWREADRVLVLGDVLNNMSLFTGLPGLHEPPKVFTPDPARNRQSARRVAALEPALVLFGHGAPLRDTRKLLDFVAALPA